MWGYIIITSPGVVLTGSQSPWRQAPPPHLVQISRFGPLQVVVRNLEICHVMIRNAINNEMLRFPT